MGRGEGAVRLPAGRARAECKQKATPNRVGTSRCAEAREPSGGRSEATRAERGALCHARAAHDEGGVWQLGQQRWHVAGMHQAMRAAGQGAQAVARRRPVPGSRPREVLRQCTRLLDRPMAAAGSRTAGRALTKRRLSEAKIQVPRCSSAGWASGSDDVAPCGDE